MRPLLNIPALLIILLTVSSCSKTSNPKPVINNAGLSKQGLTFKGNDTTKTFTNCYATTTTNSTGVSVTIITGENLDAQGHLASNAVFLIGVFDTGTIQKSGTYTNDQLASTNGTKGASFEYNDPQNLGYESAPGGTVRTTVTITEVTATYIKGTFTGKLYKDTDTDLNGVAIVVSSGEFYAAVGT